MNELKITKGKAFVSLEDTFGSKPRVETDEKLICRVGNGEDYLLTLDEWTANADLIAEAFNITNQTGLTPKQLLEQRDELLEALKEILSLTDDPENNADPEESVFAHARDVIAKAEGRS